MAPQHPGGQILEADVVRHVLDMGGKVHALVEEVGALAEAGERGREDAVAAGGEEIGEAPPAPAAMKGAMHEHERGHGPTIASLADIGRAATAGHGRTAAD